MLKDLFYAQGKADADALRKSAALLDGTGIIAEEEKVPTFDPQKDYTEWPVGAPVADEGQIYKMIQPYNAQTFQQRPAELPALWSVCHTKDPARAKAWAAPSGTSGLYTKGECYRAEDGTVWRCTAESTNFSAAEYPTYWEKA